MKDKLITIREEKDYGAIAEKLSEILIKESLNYIESFGVIELLKIKLTEDLYREEENGSE